MAFFVCRQPAFIIELKEKQAQTSTHHFATLVESGLYNTLKQLFITAQIRCTVASETNNGTLYFWRRVEHGLGNSKQILRIVPCLQQYA